MLISASNHDTLQTELCDKYPLIDAALIAAILSESDYTADTLRGLNDTLSQLSLQAEAESAFLPETYRNDYDFSDASEVYQNGHDPSSTSASSSNYDFANASSSSSGPSLSFTSPLGFLQKAFPSLPTALLEETLKGFEQSADGEILDLDMEAVVQELLTKELIRDLEERGFDDEEDQPVSPRSQTQDWSSVRVPKKKKQKGKKKAQNAAKTLSLIDTQQRHHRPIVTSPTNAWNKTPVTPDPWTHLQSLATHLSTLLPPLPPSHFLSLFHDPQHSHPAETLRHCLDTIHTSTITAEQGFDEQLSTFLGIVCEAEDETVNVEDAARCLQATGGEIDTSLELYWLLSELDAAGPVVLHSPTPVVSPPPTPALVPTVIRIAPAIPLSPRVTSPTVSDNSWSVVNKRAQKRPAKAKDPLGESIPAYRDMPEGWRSHSSRPLAALGEPDEHDDSIPEHRCREIADYYKRKQHESVRSASKHWRAGNMGNRGGDVAFHYAEESREYERKSRIWALKAARAKIKQHQRTTNKPNTIDLHGLTVNEALTLVRESVNDWWNSAGGESRPTHSLLLITGQGKHSKGSVGVIGPAVHKMLEREGWKTVKHPGNIIVTGILGG